VKAMGQINVNGKSLWGYGLEVCNNQQPAHMPGEGRNQVRIGKVESKSLKEPTDYS